MDDLEALAMVVQQRAERAMREAIRRIPDGVYKSEIWNDGLGTPERYPVRITVEGDELAVDFTGAPPQTGRGGSNCTLGYTQAHVTYPLKCMLSPEVPGNAGCYRPLTVTAPRGSILNCDKPMAVNTRVRTGWYLAPNVFMALSEALPERVQAFTGLPSSALFYGTEPDGRSYADHLFQGGGQGGSAHHDGKSGLEHRIFRRPLLPWEEPTGLLWGRPAKLPAESYYASGRHVERSVALVDGRCS